MIRTCKLDNEKMKISAFHPQSQELTAKGLRPFLMDRLGMVVALAGPNGAGKSRILETLRWHATAIGNSRHTNYLTSKNTILDLSNAIRTVEGSQVENPQRVHIQSWKDEIQKATQTIAIFEAVETYPLNAEQIQLVNFVPKSLNLSDPSSSPPNQLKSQFSSAQQPGVENLNQTAPSYLQHLQNQWFEVTHQNYQDDSDAIAQVSSSYDELKFLIRGLLKSDLGRTKDSEVTLFGKPLAQASLSDGQKVLLQLSIALHAQRATTGQVLLMDEPENHLHPAALIEVFDRIREALPDTQVWIATHSVPLLAHLYALDSNCIWYVQSGAVAFAGKRTEEVLTSLLGDSIQRDRLLQFLELPHQLAASNFATQCLTNPDVVPLRSEDPQIRQIASILREKNDDAKLRVLDIGAGKGRLLGGMAELDSNIASRLDYVAFDNSSAHRQDCEHQINSIYDTATVRWFCTDEALFAACDKNSFNAVVLCNVLHEIPPDSWPELFGSSGLLQRGLSRQGHLLIVEDMRIPVGELPNHRGYFLLDTAHLRTLFNIRESDIQAKKFISHDAREDGRLKAHLISSDLLSRVTPETRRLAITELRDTAKRKIREARLETPPSFDAGQRYGFWSQQLANCVLYLEQA